MAAKSKSTAHFHGAVQFSLRKLGKAETFFLEEQQALYALANFRMSFYQNN